VQASANLNELYVTVAKNQFYLKQNHTETNALAEKAKQLYVRDSLITKYYNDTLAGGKWSHMMDQTHIGYTYWQQPVKNLMPEVQYIKADVAAKGSVVNDTKNSSHTKVSNKAKATIPKNVKGNAFYEKDGYVSIEAEHYTNAVATAPIKWQVIPNLGRTLSGITPFPVTAQPQTASNNSPRLEYQLYLNDTGTIKVLTYLSPTLNYYNEGLRYAISIDDEKPQIINIHSGYNEGLWNQWVANNIINKVSEHTIKKAGQHVLKYWMVDAGVVLQKIVIDAGVLKPSYLGPEETRVNSN
jgi:hypothetical protein